MAVQFYSSQGVQLDRHAFLELSKEAIGQTRSKDNKEHFLKTGSLLPQALTALQEHQQFVHGFPQPLSQAPELSSR